jgi:hypothetical protein
MSHQFWKIGKEYFNRDYIKYIYFTDDRETCVLMIANTRAGRGTSNDDYGDYKHTYAKGTEEYNELLTYLNTCH